ncbi:MAG: STAS domain-containing protein [Planctomycetota bacterium]
MNVQAEEVRDGIWRVYSPSQDEWRQREGLAEALSEAAGDAPVRGVIVDLANIKYLSSAGLAAIFALRKSVADGRGEVVLARPTPSILRLLRTANLGSLVPLATTLEEAEQQVESAAAEKHQQ